MSKTVSEKSFLNTLNKHFSKYQKLYKDLPSMKYCTSQLLPLPNLITKSLFNPHNRDYRFNCCVKETGSIFNKEVFVFNGHSLKQINSIFCKVRVNL